MSYEPAELRVRPGDTIVWRNSDVVPHTATGERREFDSGEIRPAHEWSTIAPAAGEYPYLCTLHPLMKGRLIVAP